MRTIFQWLRWVCLLLLVLAWTTTPSFAAVGALNQANGGLTIRYDALETQNRGYDAEPSRAWDNNPPEMVDASAFFSSPAQFNAAKTVPDFIVTPSGVSIPTNPNVLKSGLRPLTEASTKPATSRKFVGEDSVGPMRIRIEKGHAADPNFKVFQTDCIQLTICI